MDSAPKAETGLSLRVTVDLMPVVRLSGTPERVVTLFHHKPETGTCYHKEVNPKGFADHFNGHIETSAVFQDRFDARRFLVDGETYETMAKRMASDGGMLKADTQPMPVHVPLDQKSPRVVALQLIKRFRYRMSISHIHERSGSVPFFASLMTKQTNGHQLIALAIPPSLGHRTGSAATRVGC